MDEPLYKGDGADLYLADARSLPLEDDSVDLVVTSPPYFALRNYTDGGERYDGQIGSEATPADFIDALVSATVECVRVLKPTGSIFVNLGDKFSQRVATRSSSHQDGLFPDRPELRKDWKRDRALGLARMPADNLVETASGLRPIPEKSLMGLPWRYANRCVDDLGLILRRDIIWSKPNGLPESVNDRCRSSHEYWFHFVKAPRYFAAIDELREPYKEGAWEKGPRASYAPGSASGSVTAEGTHAKKSDAGLPLNPLGKLPGSVWNIASAPLKVPSELGVDHFAAFPPEWPRRLILGWSPSGICVECGEGRRPVMGDEAMDMSRPQARRAAELAEQHGLTDAHIAAIRAVGTCDVGRGAQTQTGTGRNAAETQRLADEARQVLGGYAREFLLLRPTRVTGDACACPEPTAPTRPAVVLDPFCGTGTTVMMARAMGRHGVGVDLSRDYLRLANWRVFESGHADRVLNGKKVDRQPRKENGAPATPTLWTAT